jgi:hypothetical protein
MMACMVALSSSCVCLERSTARLCEGSSISIALHVDICGLDGGAHDISFDSINCFV